MKKFLLLMLIGSFALISSCSKEDDGDPDNNNTDCSTISLTYDSGIKAILDANCAIPTCHGGDPSIPNLTNYDNVFSRRSTIQSRVVGKSMPPASQPALSADNINKINCWIQNGAPK